MIQNKLAELAELDRNGVAISAFQKNTLLILMKCFFELTIKIVFQKYVHNYYWSYYSIFGNICVVKY